MLHPPIPLRFNGIVRYAREHNWHLTIANRLVRTPSGWNGDGALVTLRGDAATTHFTEGLIKRAACGFCNAGHFINVFRKTVSTTPAKWRTTAVSSFT